MFLCINDSWVSFKWLNNQNQNKQTKQNKQETRKASENGDCRTTAQDHKLYKSLAPWKQELKKWGAAQDISIVLHI